MFDVRKSSKGFNTTVVADALNSTHNSTQTIQEDCYRELVELAKTIGGSITRCVPSFQGGWGFLIVWCCRKLESYLIIICLIYRLARENHYKMFTSVYNAQTLKSLSHQLPVEASEMLALEGVTPVNMDKWGHRFLEVTIKYADELGTSRGILNDYGSENLG